MKYFLVFFLVIMICGCAVFTARRITDEGDGELLEGVGQGFRGPIAVQVRLNEGGITGIEIIDSAEDRFVGGTAMEELLDLVIMYNSTDIDAVSGATETSEGFLEAVRNAILKK